MPESPHPNPDDVVLSLVSQACAAPNNRFGPEFLPEHLLLVERFALELASQLGADRRIVRVAALVHDLAAILDFETLPRHAEAGADLARAALSPGGALAGLGYDARDIELVATCVREHSTPQHPAEAALESIAVSNADAMAQIARPLYWYHYGRSVKGLGHDEAVAWYRSLVSRNFERLIDVAQPLISSRYEATRWLLQAP